MSPIAAFAHQRQIKPVHIVIRRETFGWCRFIKGKVMTGFKKLRDLCFAFLRLQRTHTIGQQPARA